MNYDGTDAYMLMMMMMMMLTKDAWRYTEEQEDGYQPYDVSDISAAESWPGQEQQQQRDEYDDGRWQDADAAAAAGQNDSWRDEGRDGDAVTADAADDDWKMDRADDAITSDWTLTDDLAAGGAGGYDNSWTTDYNDSSNTAADNDNSYWLEETHSDSTDVRQGSR